MENNLQENNFQNYNPRPQDSPDSMLILILGIVSIIVTWFVPGAGIIPSIVALAKFKKANQIYLENPRNYTRESANYLKIGQITSIIGLVISALIILSVIVVVAILFILHFTNSLFKNKKAKNG